MDEKQVIKLLRQNKEASELGGDFSSARANQSWTTIASTLGFAPEAKPATYGLGEYASFLSYRFSNMFVRPAAMAVSVGMVLLISWTTGVNAAHSLPGDILYPVKIATERVRLSLAGTAEVRAQLRVEFASRRLKELSEINSLVDGQKVAMAKVAVENFSQQMNSVNQEMSEIKTENPQAAIKVALLVENKAKEYAAALNLPKTAASDTDIKAALLAVNTADNQAIDTIVTQHEETGEEAAAVSLKKSFQSQYEILRNRITLSYGRLAVIETALKASGLNAAPFQARLREARLTVAENEKLMLEAMDRLASGGYRRAFDLLYQAESAENGSEAIITELEVEITTLINAATDEPAETEPAAESTITEEILPKTF